MERDPVEKARTVASLCPQSAFVVAVILVVMLYEFALDYLNDRATAKNPDWLEDATPPACRYLSWEMYGLLR